MVFIMELEKAREDFSKLQKRIAAMNHAILMIFYDGETTAPAGTTENRIASLEVLNKELYKLKFGEETTELIDFLWENEDKLTEIERRSLVVFRRETDKKRKVPMEEYIQYESLLTAAQDAWHIANEEHDYEGFKTYLEKIFNKVREIATCCKPEMTPYEYCLDNYEPGIEVQVYDEIFDGVRNSITPLFRKIIEKPEIDKSCLKGDFSLEKQEDLAIFIMKILGLDMGRVGLATADHPFSTNMGSRYDQRIVTKYFRKDFSLSLYTMLYECGHVLYELGQGDNIGYTFIDGSASLGFLESQARFYENIVGRSKPFIEFLYPMLKSSFSRTIKGSTPNDLYLAVNSVTPGPIRMGSDEVTNNLHVLIRYETEKALMDKSLSFDDLPDAWQEKYKEYLCVEIDDPVQGVLQDIHWANGAIGYFPTSVLGNSYSALMVEKLKEELDFDSCLRKGDFSLINKWIKERIWQHAGMVDTDTLMKKYLGIETINSDAYVGYLNEKYAEIYNL